MTLPTPYYQDDWATIYCGDCREILPELPPVDLVLTDPPYGIGLDYGSFDDTQDNVRALVSGVIPLCIKNASRVMLTCGTRQKHSFGYSQDFWHCFFY